MLACVSTLQDVVSYQDVRHSKGWLTTGETYYFIRDNCPALHFMLQSRATIFYITLYNWAKETSGQYKNGRRAVGRPSLIMKRVQDNGRRDVNFFSVEKIMEEEKYWSQQFKNAKEVNRWVRFWGEAQNNYFAYLEKTQTSHGSFYDPEWFV